MKKKKIVLLQHYYNEIGGVETFLLNFCKRFGDKYDMTLVCRDISLENAIMLSKYVNVVIEVTSPIECDICIITSVLVDDEYFNQIKYKELYQMIHSDWTAMKKFWDFHYRERDPNTKYIAVSECARKSFIREFGHDSVVIPNILDDSEYQLRLVSFTRLTEEKGYKRMCQLCDLLDKYNISYIWDVFGTNSLGEVSYGNMILHNPIREGQRIMGAYDYVVQLSDTESFCLTMYEAWQNHVPTLCTPFPNAVNDLKDGINGYILPFDMNLTEKDIKKIVEKIPENVDYKQEGVEELWKKILK